VYVRSCCFFINNLFLAPVEIILIKVLHSIKVGNSKALHDTVGMGATGGFDRMFLWGV
jgi:hypothetical protein